MKFGVYESNVQRNGGNGFFTVCDARTNTAFAGFKR